MDGQDQLDRRLLERLHRDALDVLEEVDADFLAADLGDDDRGLGRCIVAGWDQQAAIKVLSQLLGGVAVAEVVQVLGGVGTILGEFGDVGVSFGPEVEGLAADDEGAVVQVEDSGEFLDDVRC